MATIATNDLETNAAPVANKTQTEMTGNTSTQTSVPFPWKVHEMLDRSDKDGFDHIVSWIPSENGFKVHDSKAFVNTVLPRFFRQTKYKSFQRQCNIWGFERLLVGPSKGGYSHPDFVRGKTNLCSRMKRQKIKGSHGTVAVTTGGGGTSTSSSIMARDSNLQLSFTNYGNGDSAPKATARSISPSVTPIVDGRSYYTTDFASPKMISTGSLKTLENNTHVPDMSHTVPASPVPDSNTNGGTIQPPKTGDCIGFEGLNFFFIKDDEFPIFSTIDAAIDSEVNPKHHRRLSLDLFAASRLENDEQLLDMLIAADASPTADFSLTSSSYFY